MEHEKEIGTLSAETLATSIVLANLLSKLARIPTLRLSVMTCFDQSEGMAEDLAVMFDKSASSQHQIEVLRIVQEMRAMVLGDATAPKHFV